MYADVNQHTQTKRYTKWTEKMRRMRGRLANFTCSQHTLFTLRHSDQTIITTQKSLIGPSDMLHFIFGTSFLHLSEFLRSELFIPLSATII